jgi:uncharacterized protein (TIGR03086 family)
MIDLQPACDGLIDLLGGISDDELELRTCCPDYSAGDLVDHLHHVVDGSTALARHEPVPSGADQGPAGHLTPAWREDMAGDLRAMCAAWDDPTAWEGQGNVPSSDLSNEVWGRIILTELVVHGWDLATATGQAFDLPEDTLRACLEHVVAFTPNAPFPGLWGTPVGVAADASPLDRIVATTGRTP